MTATEQAHFDKLAAIQSIIKIQQKGRLSFYDEHTLSSPFWLESAAFRSLSRRLKGVSPPESLWG
jgi:hypothetical protein